MKGEMIPFFFTDKDGYIRVINLDDVSACKLSGGEYDVKMASAQTVYTIKNGDDAIRFEKLLIELSNRFSIPTTFLERKNV
jgi:hypothetical protein